MMEVTIVYDNNKDREFLDLSDSKFPIFVNYINSNTKNGKREAYQIKSNWGATLNPFIVVQEGEKIIKVFYSEKSNAVQQLINYLNDSSKI